MQFDQAISIAESELSLTKVRSTRFRALQFLNSIAPPGNDPVAVSSEAQAEVVMDAAAQDKAFFDLRSWTRQRFCIVRRC